MFWRLLYQSFHRQRRSKLLAGVAIMLAVMVATAMLAVVTDVGDKISRELRTFGANIAVYPVESTVGIKIGNQEIKPASAIYLKESDLPRMKQIFWGHNILGFAPFLTLAAELQTPSSSRQVTIEGTYFSKSVQVGKSGSFVTGVRTTHPWWRVEGAWPQDDSADQALMGSALAQELHVKPGDEVVIANRKLRISGVLNTGADEERELVVPIHVAQEIGGLSNAVASVFVSALTKPEDDFARRNPASLSPKDRDRQYCSPYALSIARQIMEAIPGSHAEQIRRIAQSEGQVLSHVNGLFLFIGLAALISAVLAVSAATATAVMERRHEIGLMKALGAGRGSIAMLFMSEAAMLALAAGVCGFGLGELLARQIGKSIFDSAIGTDAALLPLVLLIACAVAALGSIAAIKRATSANPAFALRGEV